MSGKSPNKKTARTTIRRGLSIFKTGRSPYWHAQIYDSSERKYVVRTTKERKKIEARAVAEEIFDTHMKKRNASFAETKKRSFEHYAAKLDASAKVLSKSKRKPYAYRDQHKILYREGDGLVSHFGKYDISKITTGMVRDYLVNLDERRENPLAQSTKTKHCGVIRKVLFQALEDGIISVIPTMPKQGTKDTPRVSFTDKEFNKLVQVARQIAEDGLTKVRGVPVTKEHCNIILFAVWSFLRPTETELFGIRYCDIEKVYTKPRHLLMKIRGKTGYRSSVTMSSAIMLLDNQIEMNPDYKLDDYLFMANYNNRSTAIDTFRRIFNYILEKADLKEDQDGNLRSPYSLRHYSLQRRLRKSGGRINIYSLAKNAGTSVEQLERFYLRNMELPPAMIKNLQHRDAEDIIGDENSSQQ